MANDDLNAVAARVRQFYEEMPFNYYGRPALAVRRLRANPVKAYADLHALLCGDQVRTVLDVGCGTGWAANSMALHYSKQVTAIDLTQKALDRAASIANKAGIENRVKFERADLFDFSSDGKFDLVTSIGVLHHTGDCRRAFDRISQFVADGGYIFAGLYHLYGRRPFLAMFREILQNEGEAAAFQRYKLLNPTLGDESHLRSWFRDQVLHPQESQHSLREVVNWLVEGGFTLVSTSINCNGSVSDLKALIETETQYEALSERRNRLEGVFFPGFFTFLARRNEA